MSTEKHTHTDGAFLAKKALPREKALPAELELPEPLQSIRQAHTLLIEAEIYARIREFQYPETREYERLGFELSKALVLARVSIGMALTVEEES